MITSAAVSLSLALMLFFVGMADDGHARMAEIGIRLGAGHVLVQGRGYQQEQTLDRLVPNPQQVVEKARAVPGVQHAVLRVRSSGLLSAGELSSAVMLSGVDPTIEPEVSDIAATSKRASGFYLRPRDQQQFVNAPADIYLGNDLARTLEVGLGDRVVLTVSPRGESRPSSAAFTVRGTFRTGLGDLDGGYVEIPLSEAQKLLKLNGEVSQVAVVLDSLEGTDRATVLLDEALRGQDALEILSWKVALRELHEAIVLDDMGMYLMMIIIFVIVTIGIFNTVLMSVAERTREFGVMMAIGTGRWRLFSIIMAEAAVLALVSAVFGLVLGLIGHGLMAHYGIDVASMAGGDYEFAGISFSGRIHSRLSVPVVAKWTAVVIGLVLGAAVYPALRATRLQPVEAMRHV
jgi:ABC-type lipoprotein release transport system permease subunit